MNIAKCLNNYFVSIADNLIKKSSSSLNSSSYVSPIVRNSNSIFLNPVTSTAINSFIKNMDPNKSNSSDSPKTSFLKISAEVISPILSLLMNICIKEGVFPDRLKKAEVIPIFKSGKRSLPNNHRPISLLSPFAKIFEHFIYKQLNNFFNKNNILYPLQYGFREGSSTELAVSDIMDSLTNSIEKGLINCSIFLDLSKAFNTVNHKILLNKLEFYGIRGVANDLLKSYLTERVQSTLVNNVTSTPREVDTGVPQGSTLGPLLFLIYINDLCLSTNMKVRLYADDACLSLENVDPATLQTETNHELVKVNNWLINNKLFLNCSKSNFIIFTNQKINHKFKIVIGNVELQQVKSVKYLGVILHEKLNWAEHIKSLKSKLSRSSYLIYNLKKYADIKTLLMIYYSLFYSHMKYCITSWGGAANKLVVQIFNLQKRVIRFICKADYRAHTNPLFKDLELLKLNDVYKLEIGKMVHKIKSNLLVGEHDLISLNKIHNHNTRISANSNYFVKIPRTNLGKNSFSYIGPKIWQDVPLEYKNLDSVPFKHCYKQHLLQQY